MDEEHVTVCVKCGRQLVLPFVAHTPKRCEHCYRRPIPPAGTDPHWRDDADANGGWANVVMAMEEDR
mgnify:CR=1 FL=1